jgi:O-antigen/teichoic acid export membrane protein
MNAVTRSAFARVLSFAPTAIATLLTSRLIIRGFGLAAFDSYALILALIALIPLNNLGVGAAVTSAYAEGGPTSEHSRRVTLTAARVLTVSSLGTAAVSLLISALGAWPALIGTASGPNLYCGVAMAIYALSFLPGLGQSMLLGVHRNHVTVVVQTVFTPLILVGTILVIELGLSGSALMLVPPAALVAVNVATSVVASRATGISWSGVLRAMPDRRGNPGASIRALSGPVLIITLATPIALQSDRVVLSHVSTAQAVADYSVALQIFGPALALIAASAQPLWPIYAKARSEGGRGPRLAKVVAVFCAAAVAAGAALALVANPIAHLIGGHDIELGFLLPVAGALTVMTAALSYPIAMSLMDPAGARVVSVCTLVALPLNIGLSVVLGHHLGAPGPLFASALVGVVVQVLPAVVYSRSRQSIGRHRAPRQPRRRPAPGDPSWARSRTPDLPVLYVDPALEPVSGPVASST